ncbi:MAG: hypothetical protein C0467_14145 [Planctomycetaceae bacterium]|nr:hypothetical protein [Planctomycetaceae bacterium]
MIVRLLTAVLAVAIAPVAVRAADEENPYKNVKVGDFATYKMKVNVGPIAIDGTTTQNVIAKTDKEAKVKVTASVNGMEAPAQEQTIDLTKPYDPTKVGGGLPGGAEAKVEKGKEGKEKIKAAGKEFEATWTEYKVKAKANGMDIDADIKVWTAKDVPMGMVKMTMKATVAKMDMEMTMELSEFGNKK